MRTVSIEEAQMHLAQLLDEAVEGEPFVIARAGEPLAEVIKVKAPAVSSPGAIRPKRRLGALQGKFTVPDDIKTPFREEIEEMFYGKE
jgi:prevent-host-death family protein